MSYGEEAKSEIIAESALWEHRRKKVMENTTTVTTGTVRFSFVHLTKPYSFAPGAEEKYSATILVPKSDVATKKKIDAALAAATQIGITKKWGGKKPPVLPIPVYDGDGVRPNGDKFGPECKGHWVFTASAKQDRKPEIVDANMNAILDPSEIYSGMYGRVNVNFYPYDFAGKKGIGCGLGPVQKLSDGESLGGGAISAAAAFGDGFEDDGDDIIF